MMRQRETERDRDRETTKSSDRLRIRFGVGGGVLEWIRTFLVGRTQQVLYKGRLSSIGRLDFGVSQGSVLGPLLFLLYTAELFEVINRNGLVAHSYADDTQVHLSVPASESSVAARQFSECIEEIDSWMQSNRLKMNTDKTQLIWIGSCQRSTSMRSNCSWTRYRSPHLCRTWA